MAVQKLGQSTLETTTDKFQPHFTTGHASTKKQQQTTNKDSN